MKRKDSIPWEGMPEETNSRYDGQKTKRVENNYAQP